MRHVDDAARRARLLRRQLLDGGADRGVEQLTDAVVGLHATTPSTVYLSAWARDDAFVTDRLDAAMYQSRTLIKQLAMRRTLFVMTRPMLASAVGAIGARVAASERTNMLRDLRKDGSLSDPEGWIDAAREAVLDVLDGVELSSSQVRERAGDFDFSVMISPEKSYGGPSPMIPRVMNYLAARGEIVRGPNRGTWHQSRPLWTTMRSWLGEPLVPTTAEQGHADLIERWLRTYGPGTETDLVWWLGSTKTAVRKALATLDVEAVDLDGGGTGYLMADDSEPVEPVPPRALLLPGLDPTTMGYKERGFYLGPHAGQLFDNTGNGGQTAWWDGRIVGGWVQRPAHGRVEVVLLEDVPAAGRRALDERAEQLTAWLGDDRPVVGFPSPLMKGR
ncbi:MAG: winged helix DNA-binding domain-containing protein [Gordonia sp. (in: high G+C Gram-positive bacteria)]